ncbi:hypothetical protein B7C42_07645 [Nocardia cerradoensis]|uniref:Uncharacterized protein n=1 Tax=Nocardia cerradoensis TaxID=85688 RepID=A0A231GUK7_9NOCA|nr:hypothetical protein [Nocardia cerradoensis]OXR40307.1 hypothetical protein B7C42_07645 [Nocardia cerradoensis]
MPLCLPVAAILAFDKLAAGFLTGTLADDSVLVIDLDADSRMVQRPVTPQSAPRTWTPT